MPDIFGYCEVPASLSFAIRPSVSKDDKILEQLLTKIGGHDII